MVLRAVHGDRVEDALRLAHGEWPLPRRAEELSELRRADVRRVLLLYLDAQGRRQNGSSTKPPNGLSTRQTTLLLNYASNSVYKAIKSAVRESLRLRAPKSQIVELQRHYMRALVYKTPLDEGAHI